MHELPATRGMLEVALEAARNVGAGRVTSIELVVGELTSMVDDSVQFYFDLLARDTIADGATLLFRREPAVLTCRDCGCVEQVRPPLPPACPACGALTVKVEGGQAFRVESIEVEDVVDLVSPAAERPQVRSTSP